MKRSKKAETSTVARKPVGWGLRCNEYCRDHYPEDMTHSELRDLVPIYAEDNAALKAECEDCGRALLDVIRGKDASGATIERRKGSGSGRSGEDEISVTITLPDCTRDRKLVNRLLRRAVLDMVLHAFVRNTVVTSVSRSLDFEASEGFATRTAAVEFLAPKGADALRLRLARKLAHWGLRGEIEQDPPLELTPERAS